jgi:hypothetical protein
VHFKKYGAIFLRVRSTYPPGFEVSAVPRGEAFARIRDEEDRQAIPRSRG